MKDLINTLIDKLNKDDDLLLIELLKQKLYKINDKYIIEDLITKEDAHFAYNGLIKTLSVFSDKEIPYSSKSHKASRISNSRDCDSCKFSILSKYGNYKCWNQELDICRICTKRCENLNSISYKEKVGRESLLRNIILENKDILNLKTLINILNKRLYKIIKTKSQ